MESEIKNLNDVGALSADNAPLSKYVLILAGGEGSRLGGDMPKQFRMLNGLPLLWWSVKAFHEEDPSTRIILVLHPGFFDAWDIIYSEMRESDKIEVEICCGGRSRAESVKNGLMDVPSGENVLVAVHDAARPLVSVFLIRRGWCAAIESRACVPAVALTDSIRRLSPEGSVSVNRRDYVAVQTPQVFDASLLKEAYEKATDLSLFTDDASVAEAAGIDVTLFDGDHGNMKVTNPLDIEVAEVIMRYSHHS